jgi:hypothetical protein
MCACVCVYVCVRIYPYPLILYFKIRVQQYKKRHGRVGFKCCILKIIRVQQGCNVQHYANGFGLPLVNLFTLNAVTTEPPILMRFFSNPRLFRIIPIRVLLRLLYLVSVIRY